MKQAKQRVIAIDYFRGLFILAVVINHAMVFSMPFAYLAGAGRMWTSAAEMLLIISGLTFGIIRSGQIKSDFKMVLKKTWRRAAQIYLVNFIVVITSLTLALFLLSHSLPNDVDGALPVRSGAGLLWSILNYSYSIGWASFLRLYAVFLFIAPFALYVMRTKAWMMVPILSAGIYLLSVNSPAHLGAYADLGLWQLYFFIGLSLSKFRVPALGTYYHLKSPFRRAIGTATLVTASAVILLSFLFENNNALYPRVTSLVSSGWLPAKFQEAYTYLLTFKPGVDQLLMQSRSGILRPAATLILFAGLYIIFQNHKKIIMAKSGRIMTALGKDTLWIFAAQAVVIPVLATIPVQKTFINNAILTSTLLLMMWLVTQRHRVWSSFKVYAYELKLSFSQSKSEYLSRYEDAS